MRSEVFSDRLPSYIKVTQSVLEIFKMAGYFPDSPRMVSLCWGFVRKVDDVIVQPFQRTVTPARNTPTLQLQDGGYALLWKRYNNNNMAAVADVFYIFNSTVED